MHSSLRPGSSLVHSSRVHSSRSPKPFGIADKGGPCGTRTRFPYFRAGLPHNIKAPSEQFPDCAQVAACLQAPPFRQENAAKRTATGSSRHINDGSRTRLRRAHSRRRPEPQNRLVIADKGCGPCGNRTRSREAGKISHRPFHKAQVSSFQTKCSGRRVPPSAALFRRFDRKTQPKEPPPEAAGISTTGVEPACAERTRA